MNFLLFLIIILSFYTAQFELVFISAFLSGLLLDLVTGNLVGFSSLVFLIISFLIYLYRRKFSSSHLLFQLIFVVLADWLFTLFTNREWLLSKTLVLIFLSLIIFSLVNKIIGGSSSLRLEV